MDWDFLVASPMPPQGHLLHGCSLEAERADRVASGLDGLRSAVAESLHPHMVALAKETRRASQLLRDLADRSRVHASQAALVVNHLNVILPCLSKTLRDITARYEDKTVSRETRWRKMYHDMLQEAGGLPLPQRFMMYNHFLMLLLFLLVRDKNYDQGQLELVRAKILDLRKRRNIPDPVQAPVSPPVVHQQQQQPPIRHYPYQSLPPPPIPIMPIPMPMPMPMPAPLLLSPPPPPLRPRHPPRQENMLVPVSAAGPVVGPTNVPPPLRRQDMTHHWAEQIFSGLPLASRTPIKSAPGGGSSRESRAYPPFVPAWDQNQPRARRELLRRSFNGGRLVVRFIVSAAEGAPMAVITLWSGGSAWYAYRGHHEICIYRERDRLVLKRWSHSVHCAKPWAELKFDTLEELVLFYCTFMVLKARNEFTVTLRPKEFHLRGEKTLFQARIVDDGYHHSLIVFQDRLTEGIRLHAAVWDGELVECPVWTIFVTPHRHPCPLTTSGANNKLLGATASSDDDGDDTAARVGGEVGSGDGGSSRGLGSSSNKGWLEPRGRHVVWLHDVQLYVFCDKYREARMMRKRGAFELYFVAEQAAARFREVFYPPVSEPPSDDGEEERRRRQPHVSDDDDDDGDDKQEGRQDCIAGPSSS